MFAVTGGARLLSALFFNTDCTAVPLMLPFAPLKKRTVPQSAGFFLNT